jgi:hypothetical protein
MYTRIGRVIIYVVLAERTAEYNFVRYNSATSIGRWMDLAAQRVGR